MVRQQQWTSPSIGKPALEVIRQRPCVVMPFKMTVLPADKYNCIADNYLRPILHMLKQPDVATRINFCSLCLQNVHYEIIDPQLL
jgi:hypothetical protein